MNQQEPDPLIVLIRLDALARSCGWIDRHHMKAAVLRLRGLTPASLAAYNTQRLNALTTALKAKYSR